MQHLAAVAVLRPNEAASDSANDRARGAQLLGFVDERLSEMEFVRQYTEQQEYDKIINALNLALGQERLETSWPKAGLGPKTKLRCWHSKFRRGAAFGFAGSEAPIEVLGVGGFDCDVVPGVCVANDTHTGIGREDTTEALARVVAAVGHDDHSGMKTIADAHAAAVMEAYPMGACGGVEQCIEYRPIRDGIAAVAHRFGLAIGRGNAAGVEMIASDDDRRFDLAVADEIVESEPCSRAIAVSQPADARRQTLECYAFPRKANPATERGVLGKELEQFFVATSDVAVIPRERGKSKRAGTAAE